MTRHRIALSGLAVCLSLSGLLLTTGCAGSRYQRSTGTYVDDKAVTAKVKTELFKDPMVSGFDVNVTTYRGEVQLSGFVDNAEQKERAAAVARTVPGVDMVVNNLELKPRPDGGAVGTPGSSVPGTTRTEIHPMPERSAESTGDELNRLPQERPPSDRDLDVPDTRTRDSQRNLSTPQNTGATIQVNDPLRSRPGARDLEIDIRLGKATLNGKVASELERREIERRVSEIPGVESVENNLEVSPPAPVRE